MVEKRRTSSRLRSSPPPKKRLTPPPAPPKAATSKPAPPTPPPPKPVAHSVPAPNPLTTKPSDGRPLLTLPKPQESASLEGTKWFSVVESGVLAASLARSRRKWLDGSILERFWSKTDYKKKGKDGAPVSKDRERQMRKHGTAKLTIEPHIFEVTFWLVKDNAASATSIPTTGTGASGQVQTSGMINQTPRTYAGTYTPAGSGKPLQSTPGTSHGPPSNHQPNRAIPPPQTGKPSTNTPSSLAKPSPSNTPIPTNRSAPMSTPAPVNKVIPTVTQPGTGRPAAPSTPAPAGKATTSSTPTPKSSTAMSNTPVKPVPSYTRSTTPTGEPSSTLAPLPTRLPATVTPSASRASTPAGRPVQPYHNKPSSASTQQPRPYPQSTPSTTSATKPPQSGYRPPNQPPQSTAPKSQPPPGQGPAPDPVIALLAARAGTNLDLKRVMKIVASGQASQRDLEYFQRHINELTEFVKRKEALGQPIHIPGPSPSMPPASPAPQSVAANRGPISTPTTKMPVKTPTTGTPARPPYRPPQPVAPRAPPPPPPAQLIKHVLLEFRENGNDRFLFPFNCTVTYSANGRVADVTAFIVQKGSRAEDRNAGPDDKGYDPVKEYCQTVKMRFEGHENILAVLGKVVKTVEEKCERAKEGFLPLRLTEEED